MNCVCEEESDDEPFQDSNSENVPESESDGEFDLSCEDLKDFVCTIHRFDNINSGIQNKNLTKFISYI